MGSRAGWLAALALAACGPGQRDPRPNVLLITLDSVRADLLQHDGRTVAPNLQALGAAGLATEILSTSSWTLPAHVSLFTGTSELRHGVEQDGQCIPADLPTLPERLHEAGYRTFGVYSGPYLDPRFGFGRGFESYVAGYGPELAAAARTAAATLARVGQDGTPAERHARLEENGRAAAALEVASHGDRSSQVVSDVLLEELRRAACDARPFFLFAHYFDPHYDYDPPPPYDRFDPDYRGPVDGKRFGYRLAEPLPEDRDLEHLRALQAGELAWTDAQIGRVLTALDELGLAQNTLVVVTADHGEEFGEHGGLGHRRTLYDELLRVPLLVRLPRGAPPLRAPPGPIALDRIAPTILEELGLEDSRRGLRHGAAPALARLVRSPTGARQDVRVLEGFHDGSIKILREATLATRARPEMRWIDLARHPGEPAEAWSSDFSAPAARLALERYAARLRGMQAGAHPEAALAPSTEDLLGAFRALGYAGEEARLGALDPRELALPVPADPDGTDGR